MRFEENKIELEEDASHLFHIRGNENEIHAAESELRDTQKHINQRSATKPRDSNINSRRA